MILGSLQLNWLDVLYHSVLISLGFAYTPVYIAHIVIVIIEWQSITSKFNNEQEVVHYGRPRIVVRECNLNATVSFVNDPFYQNGLKCPKWTADANLVLVFFNILWSY